MYKTHLDEAHVQRAAVLDVVLYGAACLYIGSVVAEVCWWFWLTFIKA